jgi:hypothetical protein
VEVVLGRCRQRKKREAGRAMWAKRPSGPVGCVKKSFWNKKWIWEFTKALEICTRRFRRNFDTRIFPKFFYDPQGFYKNTICHAMNATLGQIKLRKSFY